MAPPRRPRRTTRRLGGRLPWGRLPWGRLAVAAGVALGLAGGLGWALATAMQRAGSGGGAGSAPPHTAAPPPQPGECRPFTVTADGATLHGRACLGADGKWAVAPPAAADR